MNSKNQELKCGSPLSVVIVGGGLVGSLAALHLAKKGYDINLYEYREDIRKAELVQGRSINLALSVRGRAGLAEVGLEDELLEQGIPMRGRMLHDLKGNTTFVPYDPKNNQCIYSVGRKHLNEALLNAAEKYPKVHLHFNQKLIEANLEKGELHFKDPFSGDKTQVSADLVVGCDGAYSAVRREMMTKPGFNYSQNYIEHGYLELCIPSKNGEFTMPHNYLHIWPRGQFMMIALPNQDHSWTVTLFMPFENFSQIATPNDLLNFFQEYFPDSIPLIGEKKLVEDFFKAKPQSLVSIKCKPYHVKSNVVLLGDAAHAMVPFYGQGMNAGFEDCSILGAILDNPNLSLEDALRQFTESRWIDAHAICDLAMYNYVEMRDLVRTKRYRLRKALDDFLYCIAPNTWVPLYNSVSFSRMPYKKCIENREWQNKIVNLFFATIAFLGSFLFFYVFFVMCSI